jgi:hypothetical protein
MFHHEGHEAHEEEREKEALYASEFLHNPGDTRLNLLPCYLGVFASSRATNREEFQQ